MPTELLMHVLSRMTLYLTLDSSVLQYIALDSTKLLAIRTGEERRRQIEMEIKEMLIKLKNKLILCGVNKSLRDGIR